MRHIGDARDMLKAHAIKIGPFRVASDLCKSVIDELDAAAATLRDCIWCTPLSVATGAAMKALGSLAAWTDDPGFGASLAKLGDPELPDSEYRELAKEVGGLLRPAHVANDARTAAIEEGRALAAAAAEQVRGALSRAALACSSRGTGGVHALEEGSLEMVEVADALEVLTKTSNWRRGADEGWMLAEKEVCDTAAESLARAVVPTLFVPLLGARDIKTTREVIDAAERVARVWSAGGAVSRAVGDAVDKFGIAPDGASVVAAAVIAHLPFTSERPMRDRVEDEVSGHLKDDVERGTAAAPNARSLVESLTHALVKRVSNHMKTAAAALRARGDADVEAPFLWILAWLERDTPALAMEAVNEVADDIRVRFSAAAEKAGDVGFKKLKLLANPIIHSLEAPATFRHRAFKGANDALKSLTTDVHVASNATDVLERLARIGRAPTPSPSRSSSLPPSPQRLVRQRKVSKEREPVPKPTKPVKTPKPPKKKATAHLKQQRGRNAIIEHGGLAMLSIAASQEDGGDTVSRDWSSFYAEGGSERPADDASKLALSEPSDEAEVTPRVDVRRRPAQSDRSNTKSKTNNAAAAHRFLKRAAVPKTASLSELGTRLPPAPPMFAAETGAAAAAAAATTSNIQSQSLSMPMHAAIWLLDLCRKTGTSLPEGADQRFLLEFTSCPSSVLEVLGRINWPVVLRSMDTSMHGMLSGVINTAPSASRGVNFPFEGSGAWASGAAVPPAALNSGGREAAGAIEGAIEGATGTSEGSGRGFGGVSGATDGRGGSSVSVPVHGVASGLHLKFMSRDKNKSGKRKLQEASPKSPDPYAFDDSAEHAKQAIIR